MISLRKYRYTIKAGVVAAVLLLFLMTTNPHRVSLGVLVFPILLISLIMYLVVMQLSLVLTSVKGSQKKKRTTSFIISLAVGFLIMLQSIGQLQPGDAAIIGLMAVVAIFYTHYFRR